MKAGYIDGYYIRAVLFSPVYPEWKQGGLGYLHRFTSC